MTEQGSYPIEALGAGARAAYEAHARGQEALPNVLAAVWPWMRAEALRQASARLGSDFWKMPQAAEILVDWANEIQPYLRCEICGTTARENKVEQRTKVLHGLNAYRTLCDGCQAKVDQE